MQICNPLQNYPIHVPFLGAMNSKNLKKSRNLNDALIHNILFVNVIERKCHEHDLQRFRLYIYPSMKL